MLSLLFIFRNFFCSTPDGMLSCRLLQACLSSTAGRSRTTTARRPTAPRPRPAPPSAARRRHRWVGPQHGGACRRGARWAASARICTFVTSSSQQPAPPLLAARSLQGKLPQLRDDLKAGWLEKRSGDSSNLNALPVDSWKWQRRWFVLAMESGFLYYFKSPEQMSTPGISPKVVAIGPCPRAPGASS